MRAEAETLFACARVWEDGVRELADTLEIARERGDLLGEQFAEGVAYSLGAAARMLREIAQVFEEAA